MAGFEVPTEQNQPLAAVTEQCVDRAALVAHRHRAGQQDLVAQLLGERVDGFDQIGVEGVPDGEHDAENLAPGAREQTRRAVRPVAEFPRRGEDLLPGFPARARLVAEHQRDQCARNADPGGDVGHGRSAPPAAGRLEVLCHAAILPRAPVTIGRRVLTSGVSDTIVRAD